MNSEKTTHGKLKKDTKLPKEVNTLTKHLVDGGIKYSTKATCVM